MKLAIPTHNRSELITTPFLEVFKNFDKYLIFHNGKAVDEYKKHNDYTDINIVVTDIEANDKGTGLPANRMYFVDNYLKNDEWVLFADDNVTSVEGVVPDLVWDKYRIADNDKSLFDKWDSSIFDNRILEIKKQGDTIGAKHIGFQTSKNYFYAHKKYRERGYVLGKMTMWKKDKDFVYDLPYTAMEDFHHTAMHIAQYGKVLICDYLWANSTHFQGGGLGSKGERHENHLKSMKYLTYRYPNLVKIKNRKDDYPDLRIMNMSEYNFQVWLKQYAEFKKKYTFDTKEMQWLKN